MKTPLLKTKIAIPTLPVRHVHRPALVKRINSGINKKLTLISAPPGYGKTALLSEWAPQCSRPIAWLTLDRQDNDTTRFIAYLVFSLQSIDPRVGQNVMTLLQSTTVPGDPPVLMEMVFTYLINEILEQSAELVLVLDNFHLIESEPVNHGICFLLENSPPDFHLILSSRNDPLWPFARLRASQESTEIRAADLRLNLQETKCFFNDLLRLHLAEIEIHALETRLEGWAAGLQMTGFALEKSESRAEFIQGFSASHQYILDYLTEELLSHLSDDLQDFILRTAVLNRLSPALCDAVTERNDSEKILKALDHGNIFTVPLDYERNWYRYHQLFADLMIKRLSNDNPELIIKSHQHASRWFARQGNIGDAVQHAFQANDYPLAAELVEQSSLGCVAFENLQTLSNWLEDLPTDLIEERPMLSIAKAWILLNTGCLVEVDSTLQKITPVQDDKYQEARIRGHTSAIRAYISLLHWESKEAKALSREALEHLPEGDQTERAISALILAIALHELGSLQESEHAFENALRMSKSAGDPYMTINVLSEFADLQLTQGKLKASHETCQAALALGGETERFSGLHLPIMGIVYGRLSVIQREWNNLTSAVRLARLGLEISLSWGHTVAIILGYDALSLALMHAGDPQGALESLQKALELTVRLSPDIQAQVQALMARLHLMRGDIQSAASWGKTVPVVMHAERLHPIWIYIILARTHIASGDFSNAEILIEKLSTNAREIGAVGFFIELMVLKAVLMHALGEEKEMLDALESALEYARPEGYLRTFLAEGKAIEEMLQLHANIKDTNVYTNKLMHAFRMEENHKGETTTTELIEPLSEREMQVLRLLATSLSPGEIASELYIAISTVKSHIKNIYGKLGVHRRYEAVQRAQDLNLM